MEDWFRIGWMDLGGNARKVGRGGEEPCIETRSHVCGNVCMIGVILAFSIAVSRLVGPDLLASGPGSRHRALVSWPQITLDTTV